MMSGSSSIPRIQVFRPTMEEFKDFSKYIEKIESRGAHKAGLAKIIPPDGWCPRKRGYDDVDLIIPAPISQVVTGRQGLYQQYNIQRRAMTVKEFEKLANSSKYRTPPHFDYEDLERKYWKNITYNSPIYGADVSGSLYDDGVDEFNIQHLNTILDLVKEDYEIQIEGVNTAYLYFGMWKTTFAWHTEDMDLYSINYLHFGAPKSWYAIPPEHGRRLERLAANFFHGSSSACPAFLRHKMTIISPQILKQYSIPFNKITQEPGEFMITFPFGYHSGFNHGYNCAESTNFALPRWIEYGKRAISCTCRNDCVKICMDVFVRRFQPDRYELWKIGRDVGYHPEDPSKLYAAPAPNKLELAIAARREERKKSKVGGSSQKIKRHPISKINKDSEKYKLESVSKDEDEDSDTKETEIYDVDDIGEGSSSAPDVKSPDSNEKSPCEKNREIEQDLMKINAAAYSEPPNLADEKAASDEDYYDDDETVVDGIVPVPETVDSPPPPLLSECTSEECMAVDPEKRSETGYLNEDLLNKFPSFKQAICSGAVKLTCIQPAPCLSVEMDVVDLGHSVSETLQPHQQRTEELGSTDSGTSNGVEAISKQVVMGSWMCEHTQGLKVKFVQPKSFTSQFSPKSVQFPVTTQTVVSPTGNSVCSPPFSVVPSGAQETSVGTVAAPTPVTSSAVCQSDHVLAVQSSTEEDDKPSSSSSRQGDKSKERKRQRKDSKCSSRNIKAASDSVGNWALPVLELWQHRPFNFVEEQKFNMHCSSIEPHCCVCMIFSPVNIAKSYPNPPNKTVQCSKVKMPAFCFGNGLDNQCILDQNPMLSRDGTSPLLVCSSCKISVHATCYGVTMMQMGPWTCIRCANGALDAECCLCVLRGGALKPTNDGRWAHILCAILIPETYFEDVIQKEPVNISRLTPVRQRLKCKYCLKSQNQIPMSGACVQCLSGKCYLPFHVTCGYMAGVVFEANDWPEPINIMCTKHVSARRKPQKRNFTPVKVGDRVLAKHKNRRWYWVDVRHTYMQEYYSVLFEDNSTSTNTLPEDIVYREFTPSGCPEINEKIRVKWTDGKIYSAIFKGSRECEIFVVEFDDGTLLTQERHQIYASDEQLPREVMSKMSHSTERQDHFKMVGEGKRLRISNSKYRNDT